ncbi:MAG TPA: hypothetical protein VF979_03305, partial [Streptosporangiaceae bacterium]
ITTLAFNLLGDGIRDAMDPRTERILAGSKSAARKRRKHDKHRGPDLDQAIMVGEEADLSVDRPPPGGQHPGEEG